MEARTGLEPAKVSRVKAGRLYQIRPPRRALAWTRTRHPTIEVVLSPHELPGLGSGTRIRTGDLWVMSPARYLSAPSRKCAARDSNPARRIKSPEHHHPCSRRMSTPGAGRTRDLLVRSQALCPLSYGGMVSPDRFELPTSELSAPRSHQLSYGDPTEAIFRPAVTTGLEPATSALTGQHSDQLSYATRRVPAYPARDSNPH